MRPTASSICEDFDIVSRGHLRSQTAHYKVEIIVKKADGQKYGTILKYEVQFAAQISGISRTQQCVRDVSECFSLPRRDEGRRNRNPFTASRFGSTVNSLPLVQELSSSH